MKTATGLTLIALGAVLAFAVNGHPWFLNLQVCGWIIMVIGVAGLAIPRSGYGWLRRQMVVRRVPGDRRVVRVEQQRNPSYIALNPAVAAGPDDDVVVADTAAMPATPAQGRAPVEHVVTTEQVVPEEETVEEFFPE
jgi:hypothetical protein